MTSWASPVDDVGGGMWSGGGPRPWWDFPAPLGTPSLKVGPNVCYNQRVTPTNEAYGQPVMCGPLFGIGGKIFTDATPWQAWFAP